MSGISNIIIFVAIAIMAVDLQEAQAYLDPGTGSYIFQLLVAFLLGGLFTMKMFWQRIIARAKKLFGIKGSIPPKP